jgi:hypothetical protein
VNLSTPNHAQLTRILAAEDAIAGAVTTIGERFGVQAEAAALLDKKPAGHRDATQLITWMVECIGFIAEAAAGLSLERPPTARRRVNAA